MGCAAPNAAAVVTVSWIDLLYTHVYYSTRTIHGRRHPAAAVDDDAAADDYTVARESKVTSVQTVQTRIVILIFYYFVPSVRERGKRPARAYFGSDPNGRNERVSPVRRVPVRACFYARKSENQKFENDGSSAVILKRNLR